MAANKALGKILLCSSRFVFSCHAMRRRIALAGDAAGEDSCRMTTMMKSSLRRGRGRAKRVSDLKLVGLGRESVPSEKVCVSVGSLLRAIAFESAFVGLKGEVMKKNFFPFGFTRVLRGLYSVGSAKSKL